MIQSSDNRPSIGQMPRALQVVGLQSFASAGFFFNSWSTDVRPADSIEARRADKGPLQIIAVR